MFYTLRVPASNVHRNTFRGDCISQLIPRVYYRDQSAALNQARYSPTSSLVLLEVLQDHVQSLRLLTIILDNGTGAANHLLDVAIGIVGAEANPLTKPQTLGNLMAN